MASSVNVDDIDLESLPPAGRENAGTASDSDGNAEKDAGARPPPSWDWSTDPHNPYQWPESRKWAQVGMVSSQAFLATLASSIVTSATGQLIQEFGVTPTQSLLPLSLYVFALGLGPTLGGPLSETIGRYPVFIVFTLLGTLFTIGVGFSHSFVGICILRFLAGFSFAPSLAISSGVLNETFLPVKRGLPSTLFILTPFLGPGMGPVIGAFVVQDKGWRWTQWTIVFFAIFAMAITLIFGRETYHPILKRRRARELGEPGGEALPPLGERLRTFLLVALGRPLHMLFTEPIVGLTSLYVSCEFATLYSFFAAVPYVFETVYHFSLEQVGLVFAAIVIGCVVGTLTIIVCDIFFYRAQVSKHPPHMVPPEYRLLPAMLGSLAQPISLFWFGWSAHQSVPWASSAAAIILFSWGNLCIFISSVQYIVDSYHGSCVASAASANSLSRYLLGGGFPLFTLIMFERLGISWASSLLAFIALALLPVPWAFFKFGKGIRAKSRYPTASY